MSLIFWTPLNNNLDSQGTGHTSSGPFGSPGYGAGKVTPKCLESGGTMTYNTSNVVNATTQGGNYCMCAWLRNKNTSVSTDDWVFYMGDGANYCKGLWNGTGHTTSLHWAYSSQGQDISCSINTQDGQWHHILFNVKNNTTCTLWVDGKEQGTINLSSVGKYTSTTERIRINSTYYAINDFRIYSHALSNKEIKEIASGLCLHYKFNFEDFYTALPYIQGTGSQYIDTGITSGQNITRLEASYFQTTTATQQILFGMYTGSGSGYTYMDYRESGSTYTCCWFGTVVDSGVAMSVGNHKSVVTTSGTSFTYTMDGKSVSGTRTGSPSGSTHYYLFADNSNGSTIYNFRCDLYYFKIWVDNVLVRDFIPCMRKYDGKLGLYDKVNGSFYASASDNFTSYISHSISSTYDRRYYVSTSTSQSNYFYITTAANKRFEIDMRWTSNSSRQLMGIHGTQDEYWGNNNGTWEKIGNSQGVGINERCVVCYDVGLINAGHTTTWIKGSSTQYVGSCSDFNTYSQSTLQIGRLTNTTSYYCNMEVYGIKVFNGVNTLIMNLIPSGNGFYDTIGKSYYTASGGITGYGTIYKEKIPDCSGFGNDGNYISVGPSTVTPIGTHSAYFSSGGNKYIEFASPWGNNTINQVTFSFWCNLESSTGYQFIFGANNNPTSGAGWISLNTESVKQWFYTGQYTNGVSGTIPNNEWHMHTLTFNKGIGRWYLDGVFQKQTDISSSRTALSAASTFTIGDSYTGSSWSGTPFNGRIADFRIYTTVLSDSDVADLYKVKESIDNTGNIYNNESFEKVSYTGLTLSKPSFRKAGLVDCTSLTEQLKLDCYNCSVMTDGSFWIPICVHYIPEGVFATSGTFDTFKYENENRWTNFGAINSATRPESSYWEFLVIHQADITGTFEYYRWKQNKNPFNATWADVEPSKVGTNVTRVAQSTSSSYGGMYWFNQSNCKMCFANSSNGNWFGCGIGALWGTDSNGYGYIPSYNGVGVRGFQIVYMRVSPNTHKANIHNGLIEPTEIKELL